MYEDRQTKIVRKLYSSISGRVLLKIITRPWLSKIAGAFMDSSLSKILINKFQRENNIDMNLYENREYDSFNDFFTRKIKPENRPIAQEYDCLIAPCDGRLSIYSIGENRVTIKGIEYSMDELIRDGSLADRYRGGLMLVFRLTVADYHRYHYPDSGIKSENTRIDGILHTVNPEAARRRAIYRENAREFFTIHSDNFGDLLMVEVGALLVGKIHNKHESAVVQRGYEAGWFDYGGSTVILCLEKDMVEILPEIDDACGGDREWQVNMGQIIGKALYR